MANKNEPVPATIREVRVWAKEKGIEVGTRGRISGDVVRQFVEETGRPIGRVETPETR